MNLEQINEIIINYNKLYVLAKSKIEVIEKFDDQYNTAEGIEDISFEGLVLVKYKDSNKGYCNPLSFTLFTFPIIWLSKTDAELEKIVVNEKELKAEKERKAKEEKQLKEYKEEEQCELEQYQRLKAKFEQ